jgi:hypothetical protein
MKGREVREMLQGKADSAVVHILASFGESLSAQQQEITELANTLDRLTDILLQLGATIEGATNTIDKIGKMRDG